LTGQHDKIITLRYSDDEGLSVATPMKIPDRYKPGIVVLASLDDAKFSEIFGALQSAPQAPRDHKELSAWIMPEIKTIQVKELTRLLDTLASLYRLRARYSVTPEKLAEDVYAASVDDAQFKEKNTQAEVFKDRLAKFLSLDSLNLVFSKAKELQLEAEHILCEARILTDLRPVFGSNVADSPTAMIIVHTLKLGYHDSNTAQHKEMFIALDNDDIAKLKETLIRAEGKTGTLKSKLDAAGIRSVDLS
jgi:hypothetical protein